MPWALAVVHEGLQSTAWGGDGPKAQSSQPVSARREVPGGKLIARKAAYLWPTQ